MAVVELVLTALAAVESASAPALQAERYVPGHTSGVQLDIVDVIPERQPHIGPRIDRNAWLEALEVKTKEHRHRRAMHHALQAELSLDIPSNDRVKGIDFKKFKKMRDNPHHWDSPFNAQMIDELEMKAVGDQLDVLSGKPSPRAVELAGELGVTLDPRSHRRPKPGDKEHPRGKISGYHWHKSRQKGQQERFDRVRQCGAEQMVQFCGACNRKGPKIAMTCDNHRLCLHCRDRRIKKFRKRFYPAQQQSMQMLWREQLLAPTRIESGRAVRGGKWDQKFITLTLPHSGDIVKDVAELPKAFRRFWRLLRKHVQCDLLADPGAAQVGKQIASLERDLAALENTPKTQEQRKRWSALLSDLQERQGKRLGESRRLVKLLRYCRVIEVTEGLAGEGHAHLHLWFLGPYIDQARIAHLWGESLSQGYRDKLWMVGIEAIPRLDEIDPEFVGCPCGERHTFAAGVQGLDHALQAQRCRLLRSGLSEKTADAIIERERVWYRNRRGGSSKPLESLYKPVVDVRACGKDVAEELCKYLIKDGSKVEGHLELLDPSIYARIYAALEGRRAIAATLGFLTPLPTRGCFCEACGTVYKRWIESTHANEKRGPPLQQELSL